MTVVGDDLFVVTCQCWDCWDSADVESIHLTRVGADAKVEVLKSHHPEGEWVEPLVEGNLVRIAQLVSSASSVSRCLTIRIERLSLEP